jgi:hypothetical protein
MLPFYYPLSRIVAVVRGMIPEHRNCLLCAYKLWDSVIGPSTTVSNVTKTGTIL